LGDLTENSEYAAAREDLAFIDGRISELGEIIREAKIIQISKNTHKQVDLGCKVTLHVNGQKEIFTIVGEWEADPTQKKISHASPLGQALLNKKVGEKVEVVAPAGKVVYTILKIE
jgi:transcription elongation factor GreA